MTIWKRLSDLIIKALDAYQKGKVKPVPAPQPVPVPVPTPTPAPAPVINPTGVRATPPGIDQAYMDANGSSEECSIEPRTGLMLRIAVWCLNGSRWQWWLLSSVGEGQISKQGGNLVFTNYSKNGVSYVCRGFADYEPQVTEELPRLVATGSTCPYDGSRRYAIIDCWQETTSKSGLILFGYCVIMAAVAITAALAAKLVRQ